jgi:hypothetical protein
VQFACQCCAIVLSCAQMAHFDWRVLTYRALTLRCLVCNLHRRGSTWRASCAITSGPEFGLRLPTCRMGPSQNTTKLQDPIALAYTAGSILREARRSTTGHFFFLHYSRPAKYAGLDNPYRGFAITSASRPLKMSDHKSVPDKPGTYFSEGDGLHAPQQHALNNSSPTRCAPRA